MENVIALLCLLVAYRVVMVSLEAVHLYFTRRYHRDREALMEAILREKKLKELATGAKEDVKGQVPTREVVDALRKLAETMREISARESDITYHSHGTEGRTLHTLLPVHNMYDILLEDKKRDVLHKVNFHPEFAAITYGCDDHFHTTIMRPQIAIQLSQKTRVEAEACFTSEVEKFLTSSPK